MDCLEIGKIINTHGLRGEVKISAWTNSPDDFENFSYVLTKGDRKLNIERVKYQKNNIFFLHQNSAFENHCLHDS